VFNRYQEDWSVRADPCVPRKPLDALKYTPLSSNPKTCLSLGADRRERLEVDDAPLFGHGTAQDDTYLIQRAPEDGVRSSVLRLGARFAWRAARTRIMSASN
jgi:hypothetical protein